MDELIRVLVVDDDPLVRSGLSLMLGGAPDLLVVGHAANGAEAVIASVEHRPHIVLMDIRMPVMDGIEATQVIRSAADPPRVIVLTTYDEDDYVLRALGAGASGFLLKDTDPEQIVASVRAVSHGEPALSPAVTSTLIERVTRTGRDHERARGARQQVARLTDREREVAQAVGRGLSNTEIAAALHLSMPTVKAYVGRLFTKLEVENRVQVALLVRDADLA